MEGYPEFDLLYREQPDTYFVASHRYTSNNPPDVKQAVRQYLMTLLVLLLVPAVNLSGLTLSRMRKRLSEIGVRKAFGASRCELMMQVISENMLYSLLGGILGLLLSYFSVFLLGIVGTFWFRTQQRRSELALRVAVGSSRMQLWGRLNKEGLLLLFLSALPAAVICYNIGYFGSDGGYYWEWGNMRFLVAFSITYVLMALMILAGIWFPARQSIRIQPAEALREE